MPTTTELNAELASLSTADNINLAYQTSLKFVSGGLRNQSGSIGFIGSGAGGRETYWTSIVDGDSTINIWWNISVKTSDTSNSRGLGAAIRCIKN